MMRYKDYENSSLKNELRTLINLSHRKLKKEFEEAISKDQLNRILTSCRMALEEDNLRIFEYLIDQIFILLRIINESPYSIYVTGVDGSSKFINRAFESVTGLKRDEIINSDFQNLEKENVFSPLIFKLVKKEGTSISQFQSIKEEKNKVFITGVPIYDEDGNISNILTNSINVESTKKLMSYLTSQKTESSTNAKRIIAESDSMKKVIAIADAVSQVESNILITGESGVGKGLIASYIHNKSKRNSESIIHINCGAIPENLLESELFGYSKGAFTGANKDGKKGLIELAHKGTLFLDEIGDLPLILQVKLLKFLQNKVITPVGSTEEINVDARIIAATNLNLLKMIEDGCFREDLFYRLNVIPLHIPPLRERPEDIYPAAEEFFKHFEKKYNKIIPIDNKFKEDLLSMEWKGNMRELENYVERYVIMKSNLDISSFMTMGENMHNDSEMNGLTYEEWMTKCEEKLFKHIYSRYKSSYKVAKVLKISQPTASRKIKKYIKNNS